MNKTTSLLIGLLAFSEQAMAQQPLYKQASVSLEDRVNDLIGRMIIEEKVVQLCAPILLKTFERVTLKKGESKKATFTLG